MSQQLLDVISLFWMVLSLNSENGEVIYENEFIDFIYLLQSALLGPNNVDEEEVTSEAKLEFIQIVSYYGEFSQFAFNDFMAECIGRYGVAIFNPVTN